MEGAGADVLVGRERALAEIRSAQASDARVVTLVGLGGIGKTRRTKRASAGNRG